MTERAIINIVYAPQEGPDHIIYKNEKGEIWHSKKRHKKRINISMNSYSIKQPRSSDSILVIEPHCVLERDYNPKILKQFKYIFTWATKALTHKDIKNKVVEINHPSCMDLIGRRDVGKDWMPWNKRTNEIIFIANNKSSKHASELYSLRIKLADLLDKRSPFGVSWYGAIPLKKPYYRGKLGNKAEVLKKVKFSVCTENSYHKDYSHNYFTEKMPEVWEHGAVPIYMGCYNIDDFGFGDKSYIDLRPFVNGTGPRVEVRPAPLINRLKNYSRQEYKQYQNVVANEIMTPEKLYHIISYKRMHEKMIDTFFKELNNK